MKTAFYRLLPALLLTLAPVLLQAQGNVRVTLLRPPPNQLRMADLWRADVVNLTDQSFEVYLHAWATEANTTGRIVDANSKSFVLKPRESKRLFYADLEPIDVKEWNPRYKDILLRTGVLPPGEYTVCVEVLLVENDSLVGEDCYDQPVELERLTPPILINPPDESSVSEKLPVFNWLAPSPLRRGDVVRYEIKIVEILGRQTAFDAMNSNPAFFIRRDIAENALRFPIGARPFVERRRYAWQIRAFLVQRFGDHIDVGESEIWWFEYRPEQEEEDGEDIGALDVGRKTPAVGRDIEIQPDTERGLSSEELRSLTTVKKDPSIIGGIIPPGVDLAKEYAIVDKDKLKISEMALKAMLHSCQGLD